MNETLVCIERTPRTNLILLSNTIVMLCNSYVMQEPSLAVLRCDPADCHAPETLTAVSQSNIDVSHASTSAGFTFLFCPILARVLDCTASQAVLLGRLAYSD